MRPRTTAHSSLRLSLVLGLLTFAPYLVKAQEISRFQAPCALPAGELVRRAAAVFARTGCRVISADTSLGLITAEYLGHERTFWSPTTFHLALADGTLFVSYWREAGIGGSQRMLRDPEADVVNPIVAGIRGLCTTPIGD